MTSIEHACRWIQEHKDCMRHTLQSLVLCSSGSKDLAGLQAMGHLVQKLFSSLGVSCIQDPLPAWEDVDEEGNRVFQSTYPALFWRKRPEAPQQILFGGHIDTVYSFQQPIWKQKTEDLFFGSGAADMKAGIVMIHTILSSLEASPYAPQVGWGVWLSADEELGSPASFASLKKRASDFDLALWFEPALPDGACVRERKGSINFSWLSQGKSAHAGRAFFEGKSAISPLIQALHQLDSLTNEKRGTTVNIGLLRGGKSKNIVPSRAFCGINIRYQNAEEGRILWHRIEQLSQEYGLQIVGKTTRPPKRTTEAFEKVRRHFDSWAKKRSIELSWQDTGGVCDGNTLAEMGIPTLDTLGPIGESLHSEEETVDLHSFITRCQWITAALMDWIDKQALR